jgi:hypothetical protein
VPRISTRTSAMQAISKVLSNPSDYLFGSALRKFVKAQKHFWLRTAISWPTLWGGCGTRGAVGSGRI